VKVVFKLTIASFILVFIAACSDLAGSDEKLDAIYKELSIVQQQLQLVTKEIVSLNTKLDNAGVNAPSGKSAKAISLLLENESGVTARIGSKDAQYAMIEFMDYQCPYCVRHAKQVFPKIKKKYVDTGIIQYIVRDFPLDFHSQGKLAAQAARCALAQDQFLPMHQLLSENSRNLKNEIYAGFAEKLALDMPGFNACMQDLEITKSIDADVAYGIKVGVSGTPRFYIGRIEGDKLVDVLPVSGAVPLTVFDKTFNKLMAMEE
jgi:protein-disulfide isomerase